MSMIGTRCVHVPSGLPCEIVDVYFDLRGIRFDDGSGKTVPLSALNKPDGTPLVPKPINWKARAKRAEADAAHHLSMREGAAALLCEVLGEGADEEGEAAAIGLLADRLRRTESDLEKSRAEVSRLEARHRAATLEWAKTLQAEFIDRVTRNAWSQEVERLERRARIAEDSASKLRGMTERALRRTKSLEDGVRELVGSLPVTAAGAHEAGDSPIRLAAAVRKDLQALLDGSWESDGGELGS